MKAGSSATRPAARSSDSGSQLAGRGGGAREQTKNEDLREPAARRDSTYAGLFTAEDYREVEAI